jgi:hypothetical protein
MISGYRCNAPPRRRKQTFEGASGNKYRAMRLMIIDRPANAFGTGLLATNLAGHFYFQVNMILPPGESARQ